MSRSSTSLAAARALLARRLKKQIAHALRDQPKIFRAVHYLVERYRRFLALVHTSADSYTALGSTLIGRGKSAAAIPAYQKALKLAPGRRDACYGLGMALFSDSRCEEAVNWFRELTITDPDHLPYHFGFGASLHLSGQLSAAVAAWATEMQIQARLAEAVGLSTTTRYLPGIFTMSIGHMAHIDIWAKRQILGGSPAERYVILAPVDRIANAAYLDCWKEHLDVVKGHDDELADRSRLLDDNLTVMSVNGRRLWFLEAACEIEDQWAGCGRGPLLRLSEEQIARGRNAMDALGLPRDAWFVALHVRDSGYYKAGKKLMSRRNADITDYLPAIRKVIDAGGWVVRLGDSSASPIPDLPHLIDYAHAKRKDWLDTFLMSSARFFIGTNSGPMNVANTFGVPVLITNSAPIGIQPYFSSAITLPQRLWSTAERRELTFAEQMAEPFAWTDSGRILDRLGVVPITNTSDEIVTGVEEMLARADRTWYDTPDDTERQQCFKAILAHAKIAGRGRIASAFLKTHAGLLA